jgi:hypothetical protein
VAYTGMNMKTPSYDIGLLSLVDVFVNETCGRMSVNLRQKAKQNWITTYRTHLTCHARVGLDYKMYIDTTKKKGRGYRSVIVVDAKYAYDRLSSMHSISAVIDKIQGELLKLTPTTLEDEVLRVYGEKEIGLTPSMFAYYQRMTNQKSLADRVQEVKSRTLQEKAPEVRGSSDIGIASLTAARDMFDAGRNMFAEGRMFLRELKDVPPQLIAMFAPKGDAGAIDKMVEDGLSKVDKAVSDMANTMVEKVHRETRTRMLEDMKEGSEFATSMKRSLIALSVNGR